MDLRIFNTSRMNIPAFNSTSAEHHRLTTIKSIASQMRRLLNRPLRVLELGCGPTFFSLHLAKDGDEVVGLDTNLDNVIYCQRFSKAHGLTAQFHDGNYATCFSALADHQFDLLLGFYIFSDMTQRIGFDDTKQFVRSLATRVKIALLETALAPPLKGQRKKPKPDPYHLFDDFAFIEPLCKLDKVFVDFKKTWFFCSNFYWYTHQELQPFTTWTDTSREIFPFDEEQITHTGKRRYYFTETHILKHSRLIGRKNNCHAQELRTEIDFLKTNYSKLPSLPKLIDYRVERLSGWLLREKFPGARLSTAIEQAQPYHPQRIITQVLQQLVELEEQGLYQQDLRTWNFILNDQGDVRMIDFGRIGPEPTDVLSFERSNILTFFMFAYEVIHGIHLEKRYLAPMHLNVRYFPDFYQPVLLGITNHHFKEWTYRLLLKYWQEGWETVKKGDSTIDLQPWLDEMEALKHSPAGFEPFEALFKKKLQSEIMKVALRAEILRWLRPVLTFVRPKSSIRLINILRRWNI